MRHGFLLIDKPRGPTSHDVVAMLRRSLPESSIGHLGTLDPMATGLLVLAVGSKALKVVELFQDLPKEYVAELTLGSISTTYDAEGMISASKPKPGWLPPADSSRIQALIDDHFLGKISQVPPAHSAVHIGGQRAYALARAGQDVVLPERKVQIEGCVVESYAFPLVALRVACSSGTYIRSLAHDLGQTMRCGAYLSALRRTSVGPWHIANAQPPDLATWSHVIRLKDVLAPFPRTDLTSAEWQDIQHGRSIVRVLSPSLIAWFDDLPVALLEADRKKPGWVKPRKVL